MVCRCTIKCPTLPTDAKGILPDNTLSRSEIIEQTRKNDRFNAIATELGDRIQSKLLGVDITWCKDGCIVLSAEDTMTNVETCIKDLKLEIIADRPKIKHKVRTLQDDSSEEDIDEVLVQDETKSKNTLKSISVTNQYKIKKALEV